MIGLELKADPKTDVKLPLSSKEHPSSTLSFASFLNNLQDLQGEQKVPQNGALVLSMDPKKEAAGDEKAQDSKTNSSILSLLKGEDTEISVKEDIKALELNPKVLENKTISELKVIIQEAKQYLKNKITTLEGFKKSEIASLPKTLKGLVQVAQKFGIEVSKITLEEVEQSIPKTPLKSDDTPKSMIKPDDTSKGMIKPESIAKSTFKNDVEDEKSEKVSQKHKQIAFDLEENTKSENVKLKQTPLFQAQTKRTEISTQQFVATKSVNETQKQHKQKTENTLELLLRGEKAIKSDNPKMLSDFSVATAKVIAPSAKTQGQQNLESLLSGESSDELASTKTDTLQTNKAESFEVKLGEAKQMVKYLSNDVKQAIEDYKAPFTRVKLQLNPQKLGEVDLTVVQRGNNLHVNLSSNNAAINTLAMHAQDLKVQLNNSGIQNASLNFSNMSQGDQSGTGS
ncbi:MAG: flagellar hook-length control protein FliK, partial [Sulfurimonas sp.]